MKKIFNLTLIVVLIAGFASCKKMKEKSIARKIAGKWELTELTTKMDGNDTSITDFSKTQIIYEFNECNDPDTLRPCNGSYYIINNKDTAFANVYYPLSIWYMGEKKKDANKVKILVNGVSKMYNIKEYKKDVLELAELDSAGTSEVGVLKAKAVEETKD